MLFSQLHFNESLNFFHFKTPEETVLSSSIESDENET